MNWRQWVFERLQSDPELEALVGDRIYSTLRETPQTPFIVIRFSTSTAVGKHGEFQDIAVWVHDQPDSFARIDIITSIVRGLLVGPVVEPDAIYAEWSGDSGDLADDARNTVLRNTSYRLVGRRAA